MNLVDYRSSFVTMMNVTDVDTTTLPTTTTPFVLELISEGRFTFTAFTPDHGEAIMYTR